MADNPLKRPGTYVDTSPERLLYEERHCGSGWTTVVLFWLGLVLIAVGLASSPVVIAVGATMAICAAVYLAAVRPIGIRVTTKRVTVGALAFADGRDVAMGTRKDGTVPQRRWVYSCGWEGIRSVVIVTGRQAIKNASMEAGFATDPTGGGVVASPSSNPLGLLVLPGARTLLTIRVDPALAQYPRARQKRRHFWHESQIIGAPTRHPEKLRAALASFPTAERITAEITPSTTDNSFY